MKKMIYIADDEKSILNVLKNFLISSGYEVQVFENGEDLLSAFEEKNADLVVLDIMMPGKDGLQCCRELRSVSQVPIILLTARDSELDYVQGITTGSDDFLTKPFSPTVLLMRIKALLRRVEMSRNDRIHPEELSFGDLKYRLDGNTVLCNERRVEFTQTEFRLLAYMLENPEKVYSREELLEKVWGYEVYVETRVTDETVRRVRRKLMKAGSRVVIETIWGFGYRLSDTEKQS